LVSGAAGQTEKRAACMSALFSVSDVFADAKVMFLLTQK
jgi:hypothetical protein